MDRRTLLGLALSLLAEPALAETARRRARPAAPRRTPAPTPRAAMGARAAAGTAAAGAAGGAAAAQAQPQPAAASTAVPRGRELPAVEAYLNSVGSLKARFLQLSDNGAQAQGTAWIVRPGRMRFEYDPPDPMLMVANAGQFFYFDRELRQPSVVPVGSTPLGLLLRENMRFDSGEVTVSGVEHSQGLIRISMYRAGRQAEGTLTLVFADDPVELRQWLVRDSQGRETRVTLSNIERDGRFPSLLFEFNNPIFREQLGIPQ